MRNEPRERPVTDEGGPARLLVLAPDHLRCAAMVNDGRGGSLRCTRYTVRRRDGSRTTCCVAHSDDAEVLRRRAEAGEKRRKQREQVAAQRVELARSVLPVLPTTTLAVQEARFQLARLVLERKVTASEANVVRELLRDAVAQQNSPPMWTR